MLLEEGLDTGPILLAADASKSAHIKPLSELFAALAACGSAAGRGDAGRAG